MFKKNEKESNGVSHGEYNIDATNGYNENTLFKASTSTLKAAALRQQQINLSIVDETYNEPICLESGGYLLQED